MVTLCEFTPESTGKLGGRGPALWAFGFEALAKLLGISVEACRRAVREGRLDPSDLEMVCESWMHYHPHRARQFVSDLDWREKEDRTARTPEEKQMLAALRAAREERLSKPDPREEAERMVQRCKEAPITRTGPTPDELLDREAKLDPEVMGDILARCAAGSRDDDLDEYAERLLIAGGFPPEAARVMVKARRGPGPRGPDPDDPTVPF